jgi:hypothetical protein
MKRITADQAAKTRSRCWIGLARATPAAAPDRHRIADYYPRSGQPRRQPQFPVALLAALFIRGRGARSAMLHLTTNHTGVPTRFSMKKPIFPVLTTSRSRTSLVNNCAVAAVGIDCL